MHVRTAAALANGTLVFALYLIAWGAPSWTILAIEVVLAVGASWSTWYALKKDPVPRWVTRHLLKTPFRPAQA